VQRFATGPVIVVLALFAVYIVYNATRVALAADGDESATFWPSIVILYLIAAASAWVSYRLYRLRAAKRRKPLTNG
jgi:uncharacterized integral membrane protein